MSRMINVKVIPNSREAAISEGDPMVVKVREPPEGNKANIAVLKLLSRHFDAEVRLISGQRSRRKVFEILTE